MSTSRLSPSRLLIVATLGSLLVACSGEDGGAREASATRDAGPTDPPGVAQALSLAGQFDETEKTDFDRAIACAAALRITAKALAPMTSGANSNEVRLINSASEIFAKRANASEERGGKNVERAIASRVIEKTDDRTGQAQLAITCANSLDG